MPAVVPELAPLMAPPRLSIRAAMLVERTRNRLGRHPAVRQVRALLGRA